MRKINIYGIILGIVLLTGFMLLFQSCDLTSQKEPFKNPYTEKVNRTFDQVSKAVFDNVAENVKDKAYGTVTRDDILSYANEGYAKWAQKNDANTEAFNAGISVTKRLRNFYVKKSTKSSAMSTVTLDSLLSQSNLTDKQKNYILKLP